ncbi:MAG TPA: hypothetical protein VFU30_05790 [Gaiellaceae bacterium]|nr:hypothetical protein [Gaiellaceae bacterium]
MRRTLIPFSLALFAIAAIAVPAASAQGGSRGGVRVQGTCTRQSTSTLKLAREDRGIEVEFEVDQNRNAVPWKVTFRRNGVRVASFNATTHAPSGSFEVRRVIAGRLGVTRITATATRASGETCTARSGASADSGTATGSDDSGHGVGDDHGGHSGGHA